MPLGFRFYIRFRSFLSKLLLNNTPIWCFCKTLSDQIMALFLRVIIIRINHFALYTVFSKPTKFILFILIISCRSLSFPLLFMDSWIILLLQDLKLRCFYGLILMRAYIQTCSSFESICWYIIHLLKKI